MATAFSRGLDEEAGSPLTYVVESLTGAAETVGVSTVLMGLLQPFLPKAILYTLRPVGETKPQSRGLPGST